MRAHRISANILLLAAVTAAPLAAGPPLVCHSLEIGDAASLPDWKGGWQEWRADYDASRLVADTLDLLSAETSVIVRMETLRRAVLHGRGVPASLDELQDALQRRWIESRKAGEPDPGLLFDLGYFLEVRRILLRDLLEDSDRSLPRGYPLVARAIAMSGGDPAMHLGAAIITARPRRPEHAGHLRAALQAAEEGGLLARNLVRQFGHGGEGLAALRRRAREGKHRF